jgi:hypothetical protein
MLAFANQTGFGLNQTNLNKLHYAKLSQTNL